MSRDNIRPTNLQDNDTVEGDRIEIQAKFPNSTENPQENVVNVQWSATSGFLERRNGSLVIPYDGYEPFIMGLEIEQFAWERVDDIKIG
ncbi:MAG: hypothetical protein ACXAEF_15685, partial [Candidatus Thorarchaeota archaeon]